MPEKFEPGSPYCPIWGGKIVWSWFRRIVGIRWPGMVRTWLLLLLSNSAIGLIFDFTLPHYLIYKVVSSSCRELSRRVKIFLLGRCTYSLSSFYLLIRLRFPRWLISSHAQINQRIRSACSNANIILWLSLTNHCSISRSTTVLRTPAPIMLRTYCSVRLSPLHNIHEPMYPQP